ncbi:DeoR/GlpR family DNA-binding transcription regulator [Amycolatopsis anabasis]|uniref:DeoR/GlpR family DNA-binding transcription regulator n=1 Tax=Amycolatopsis anabasis TaxID=1840409 RepID=UPI00131CBF1E|nr:DeoR/GlpR family DNA-binding transcription regulator [Amycolatopsis anabasis]
MTETERPGGSPRERRDRIRDRVLELGSVRIDDLAAELAVSPMTIHRDLDRLAEQGWLRKVRGAATAEQSALFESNVRYRMAEQEAAKARLADAATRQLERGQAIVLDDSTTCLHLAERLPEFAPMTVITNFLAVVNRLAGESGIELISLGGTYFPPYDAFLGMSTADAARPLRADVLFMSTSAITEGYCYHQSEEEILVKRALMGAAGRRILLADHTKFRKRALYRLAALTEFDLVIVDQDTPEAELQAIGDLGVPVEIAQS